MAIKQKPKQKPKIILKDCATCLSSTENNKQTYCKLRLKDDTIYADSSIVIQEDCIWYEERKIKNAK